MEELGTLGQNADGRCTLRMTRQLPYPVETVWAALTEPDQLDGWLGRLQYEPAQGSPLTIDFGDGVAIWGTVIAFEPPRRFSFTWSERADEPDTEASTVQFDLATIAAGTRLILTHSRQSSRLARATAAGWHAHLDLLIGHLTGRAPDWDEVYPIARKAYEPLVRTLA